MTIFLKETAASGWGSRSPPCTIVQFLQRIQTGEYDWAMLMTFLSSWALQSANLARPAEGIFMRQQHNATFAPTHCWRLTLAMLPAASASVLSAAVKALHRARNQRFRLIKDGHLPQERGKETWDFQRICTGFVAPSGQRLGERQRRTAWWARRSKDTANDHLVQTCLK